MHGDEQPEKYPEERDYEAPTESAELGAVMMPNVLEYIGLCEDLGRMWDEKQLSWEELQESKRRALGIQKAGLEAHCLRLEQLERTVSVT
jgi:hypothetical protein